MSAKDALEEEEYMHYFLIVISLKLNIKNSRIVEIQTIIFNKEVYINRFYQIKENEEVSSLKRIVYRSH